MLLDKVTWQEGMLLRPQHLQHNDRYYHQQLARRSIGAEAQLLAQVVKRGSRILAGNRDRMAPKVQDVAHGQAVTG